MSLKYVLPSVELANRIQSKEGYYVYGWCCVEWGHVCFYVGKGKGNRYCSTRDRGKAFTAIFDNWTVYPVILYSGLTVEDAEKIEDKMKTEYIFNKGFPIMDGEGNSAALKNRAFRLAKEELRKQGKLNEGRPRKDRPDFEKFLKKQKEGLMTVDECCAELNISRRTWYNRVKEAV